MKVAGSSKSISCNKYRIFASTGGSASRGSRSQKTKSAAAISAFLAFLPIDRLTGLML